MVKYFINIEGNENIIFKVTFFYRRVFGNFLYSGVFSNFYIWIILNSQILYKYYKEIWINNIYWKASRWISTFKWFHGCFPDLFNSFFNPKIKERLFYLLNKKIQKYFISSLHSFLLTKIRKIFSFLFTLLNSKIQKNLISFFS